MLNGIDFDCFSNGGLKFFGSNCTVLCFQGKHNTVQVLCFPRKHNTLELLPTLWLLPSLVGVDAHVSLKSLPL